MTDSITSIAAHIDEAQRTADMLREKLEPICKAWDELQVANAEVERLEAEVKKELGNKAFQEILINGHKCASWPAFAAAVALRDDLRKKHGV